MPQPLAGWAAHTAALLAVLGALVTPASAPGGERFKLSFESELLARVNSMRAAAGRRPLRPERGLRASALAHSRAMVRRGFFDHDSPDGTSFSERISRYYRSRGYKRWRVAENLAWGRPRLSPREVVRLWLQSPGHRSVLLSRSFREVGFGAVSATSAPGEFGGSRVTVVTADFGTRY